MSHATRQVALITGGSRGLGLALAKELAGRGWRLVLNARTIEPLEAARMSLCSLTDVLTVVGDVSENATRERLLRAVQSLGGLDLLVNNASILGPSPLPSLLDYPLDQLHKVLAVNAVAPLALIQSLRDDLRSGARLINITSDAGVEAYPRWGGYGSSKAALEQISAVLAIEQPSWRVYMVDPGDMRTQMHQDAFPGEDISDRPLPEESVPGLVGLIEGDFPSGRYFARNVPRRVTA